MSLDGLFKLGGPRLRPISQLSSLVSQYGTGYGGGMSGPGNNADASPTNATSMSMLDRVRGNDPEAWRRFVQLYSPLVFHWCRKSNLGPEDAADLLQEVFRSVSTGLVAFRRESTGAFRSWLWTITRNKLNDFYRAAKDRPLGVGGSSAQIRIQEIPDTEPEPGDDSPTGEGRQSLLIRALDLIRGDFEDHTWQAFWRSAIDGQTASEIGGALGMKVDAVYQAKARVLRRLRDELGDLM